MFVRITSYSWSTMVAVDRLFFASLFLALFLSVCLSFTLLFSFHFYLYSVLDLFFHVDNAKAFIPCASAKLRTGYTPPTVDGDVPACMKLKPMKEEGIISSSKSDNQAGSKELKDITFIVLQKNMRSMNTSERIDEMLNEAENYK